MSCAIDQYAQWTDRAALSMDPLVGRAVPSVDEFEAGRTDWHGPSCTFYRSFNCPCALGGWVMVSYMRGYGKALGILRV